MNKKLLGLVSLLITLATPIAFGAQNNALNLSESDLMDLINGKIEKVQEKQHKDKASKQQMKHQPPVAQKKSATPRYIAPPVRPVRKVDLSSIPAWRRPASPTMTRSPDDALFGAAKSRNLNLLKQLVAEGANVNHQNFNGETALHIAASLGNMQMVQYLLSQGANVNAKTGTLWMPIHHAMRFDHAQVANLLIARKASLYGKTVDGFTALDFANKSKNPHIQSIAKKYGH